MTQIDTLLDKLRRARVRRGMSIASMAGRVKMHPNTFLAFDKGKAFNPTVETIRRLERALLRRRKRSNGHAK